MFVTINGKERTWFKCMYEYTNGEKCGALSTYSKSTTARWRHLNRWHSPTTRLDSPGLAAKVRIELRSGNYRMLT